MTCKIAIVGGGLSGLSALRALIDTAPAVRRGDLTVTVFDGQPLGRGCAFAADQDSYLFNTLPMKTWGTCAQNPMEYYHWLKEYQPGSQDTYVPRSYYRHYLLQCLEKMKSVASLKSITFETVCEEVIFARKEGDSIFLGTRQNTYRDFNQVVFALGNIARQPYKTLHHHPKYVPTPYSGREMDGLNSHDHILILGSRLSAVDILVALQEKGHEGKITVVSKSGLLNKLKDRFEYTPRFFVEEAFLAITDHWQKPLSLKDFDRLFTKEMVHAYGSVADWEDQQRTDLSQHELLLRDISFIEKKENYAYNVLVNSLPILDMIWRCFSDQEKIEFVKKYRDIFGRFLAPIPLRSARKIKDLFASGQLEVLKGLKDIHVNGEKIDLIIDEPYDKKERLMGFDLVFNACGFIRHTKEASHPLLANLVKSGLFTPHPMGGVEVDQGTMKVKGQDRVYLLGNLVRADRFPANITPYIVKDAAKAARSILSEI